MAKNKVLSITEIEDGVKRLLSKNSGDDFITQFLALYDIPKTSITRAKSKFDKGGPFIIKNKLHYEEIEGDVVIAIDAILPQCPQILLNPALPRFPENQVQLQKFCHNFSFLFTPSLTFY